MAPDNGKLQRRGTATLREVAAHAGVSKSTVSLVVRNSPLVAAATRARVAAAMREVGYVYNRGAATMRSSRTDMVALVVPQIDNPFFGELTAGAGDALDRAGFVSFLANTAENPDRQERFLERMREHSVDGIVMVLAAGTPPELVRRLRTWAVPCVQVMRHVLVKETDYVAPDYRLATDMMIGHLVGLGHRRIAFIGGAVPVSVTRERKRAFGAVMRHHGLDDSLVFPCQSNFGAGAAAIREVFAAAEPPTAAMCYNDIVAMGVTAGLSEMGMRAGADFAVVGFDDIAEAAAWSPPLTTVATDPRRIGEEAAKLLIRRIADPYGSSERVVLPPRLVLRQSCGQGSGQGSGRSGTT